MPSEPRAITSKRASAPFGCSAARLRRRAGGVACQDVVLRQEGPNRGVVLQLLGVGKATAPAAWHGDELVSRADSIERLVETLLRLDPHPRAR